MNFIRGKFGVLSDNGVAIRVFLTCWIIFGLHFATNTVREIFPALSLGDHLSFDVSEYEGLHPDIFRMDGRGVFINNNPGASVIGAVPYAAARPLTDRIIARVLQQREASPAKNYAEYDSVYPMAREFYRAARERGYDIKFGLAAGLMQAFAMAPISAFAAMLMFWTLFSLSGERSKSAMLAILFAVGTPVIFRTAQLNQNILVASFAFFSFYALWRPFGRNARPLYFWSGIFAGWTVVLDYSGLVAVLVLTGYAFFRWRDESVATRRIGGLVSFAGGVTICAIALMAYQWSCFGNPILPAQSYMPPANFTEMGYRGFSLPSLDLLSQTAFSLRYGLFTSAPILLLAGFYWFRGKDVGHKLAKRELWFIVIFVALFFLFCSANQYGRMQFNTGVRHVVPVVPFLFILAALTLMRLPSRFAAALGVAGAYWAWCLAMYRDVELGSGVFESIRHITLGGPSLPWLETLHKMGYLSGVPTFPFILAALLVIAAVWLVRFGRQGSLSKEVVV